MSESLQVVFAVVVLTITILLMVLAVAALVLVNARRRLKHRADMEEAARRLQQEVLLAEREAIKQTLNHIGLELHDNVGQLITSAQLAVYGLRSRVSDLDRMDAAEEAIDRVRNEVRRISHGIMTDMWERRMLAEAIRDEADRIERVVRQPVAFSVSDEPRRLDPDASTILYRVFQEAVNNALKHSQASRISIGVRHGPPFRIEVIDDGKGFDPATIAGQAGLSTIRHRCALIGFHAACVTAPGQGCRWTFTERLPEPAP
jgi:signal transduction histidine kinase